MSAITVGTIIPVLSESKHLTQPLSRCVRSILLANPPDGSMRMKVITGKGFSFGADNPEGFASIDSTANDSTGLSLLRHGLSHFKQSEAIHIFCGSGIVLPTFYDVMRATMEAEMADYVFCHAMVLDMYGNRPASVIKTPINTSQVLVRRWVLEELGVHKIADSKDAMSMLFSNVINHYSGVEVPVVLCVF